MKAWRFTTEAHAPEHRRDAWRDAKVRLRLPMEATHGHDDADASVVSLISPMGMAFYLVSAGAHEIAGHKTDHPAAIWLAVLLEGAGVLHDGETEEEVSAGDIVFGPTGLSATLRLTTRFQLLFVTAPRVALGHKLVAPEALEIGLLSAASGVNHVFSGMLLALAENLEEITGRDLRPVELAVTEFLAAGLAAETPSPRGVDAVRAAHLHRVQQTIESLLGETGLRLTRVAEVEGVSPRYLQKLFAATGVNFTNYLRERRLERCRLDMLDPRHAEESITSIGFRWGFMAKAHFTRSFREKYGMPPSEFRHAHHASFQGMGE